MTTMNVNVKTQTIEMTKKFSNAAAKFGTDEYKMLQEARRDYPNFKVVTVVRKSAKPAYKGLTFSYMEKYIEKHDNEEKSIMAQFRLLRAEDEESLELGAEAVSYLEIKDWFLNTFPAIREYHENRAKLLGKIA